MSLPNDSVKWTRVRSTQPILVDISHLPPHVQHALLLIIHGDHLCGR